ncbi:MAG TPA: CoA transferase, partial [Chloroflexota bacterium]
MAALDGIRVIDFGHYIAGPLAAVMLADAGAEVIHVDPPGGPSWKTDAEAFLQRSKQRITLDLKAPDDLAVARRLIGTADVVIENFRPGVMDRLGVG